MAFYTHGRQGGQGGGLSTFGMGNDTLKRIEKDKNKQHMAELSQQIEQQRAAKAEQRRQQIEYERQFEGVGPLHGQHGGQRGAAGGVRGYGSQQPGGGRGYGSQQPGGGRYTQQQNTIWSQPSSVGVNMSQYGGGGASVATSVTAYHQGTTIDSMQRKRQEQMQLQENLRQQIEEKQQRKEAELQRQAEEEARFQRQYEPRYQPSSHHDLGHHHNYNHHPSQYQADGYGQHRHHHPQQQQTHQQPPFESALEARKRRAREAREAQQKGSLAPLHSHENPQVPDHHDHHIQPRQAVTALPTERKVMGQGGLPRTPPSDRTGHHHHHQHKQHLHAANTTDGSTPPPPLDHAKYENNERRPQLSLNVSETEGNELTSAPYTPLSPVFKLPKARNRSDTIDRIIQQTRAISHGHAERKSDMLKDLRNEISVCHAYDLDIPKFRLRQARHSLVRYGRRRGDTKFPPLYTYRAMDLDPIYAKTSFSNEEDSTMQLPSESAEQQLESTTDRPP